MILLSEMLEAEVIDERGEPLGRLHDVRVEQLQRRTPEGHRFKVVGIVIGGRGIRERFGLDTAGTGRPVGDGEVIPWERVLALEDGRIRVRND